MLKFFEKFKNKKDKLGFTLIELLVVIAMIMLLSTIIFVYLNSARIKARDARRRSDIRQMGTAMNMYYDSYGTYQIFSGDQPYEACSFPGVPGCNLHGYPSSIDVFLKNSVPKDPINNATLYYKIRVSPGWPGIEQRGLHFCIYGRLEQDPTKVIMSTDRRGTFETVSTVDCGF